MATTDESVHELSISLLRGLLRMEESVDWLHFIAATTTDADSAQKLIDRIDELRRNHESMKKAVCKLLEK